MSASMILFVIGIGLLVGGILFFWVIRSYDRDLKNNKTNCICKTRAVIVDVIHDISHSSPDDYSETWSPVYEYETEKGLRVRSQCSLPSSELYDLRQGMEVDLFYDPKNPTEIYVPAEEKKNAGVIRIFRRVAAGFVAGGALFLVIGAIVLFALKM